MAARSSSASPPRAAADGRDEADGVGIDRAVDVNGRHGVLVSWVSRVGAAGSCGQKSGVTSRAFSASEASGGRLGRPLPPSPSWGHFVGVFGQRVGRFLRKRRLHRTGMRRAEVRHHGSSALGFRAVHGRLVLPTCSPRPYGGRSRRFLDSLRRKNRRDRREGRRADLLRHLAGALGVREARRRVGFTDRFVPLALMGAVDEVSGTEVREISGKRAYMLRER